MNLIKKLKWFYQRGKTGYADCDWWDFHSYLCDIIVAGLTDLKEKDHGCPNEYRNTDAEREECKKWTETLEEIIDGFEAGKLLIDNNCVYLKKEISADGASYYKYEYDEELAKKLSIKFDKGMELFKRNFMYFWD